MFRKMPFVLILLIGAAVLIQPLLPLILQAGFYALSLTIKSIIVFLLPIVIFSMLFKAAVELAKKASKVILFLFVTIVFSNLFTVLLSYGVAHTAYQLDVSMHIPDEVKALEPLWSFLLPKWIGNGSAMLFGLVGGILMRILKPKFAERSAYWLDRLVTILLKAFLVMVPLFIFGFVVKMVHDDLMIDIVQSYAGICLMIALAAFSYGFFLYLVASRFQWKKTLLSIKNMFPALAAAFGSMSSAAAMPMTLLAAEKNNKNPGFAKLVTAATVNIHLLGDCFAIPILAFGVIKSFGLVEPTFITYLTFAIYFVITKFSGAAVPGGSILVMLPILESCLGFDGAMLSLITAIYFLFDPIVTSANVFGNGGFAMIMDRVVGRKIEKEQLIEV